MEITGIDSAIHQTAALPATLQNGLWKNRSPIHGQWTFFHSTGIIPGKSLERLCRHMRHMPPVAMEIPGIFSP